jgi:hypothetical protein
MRASAQRSASGWKRSNGPSAKVFVIDDGVSVYGVLSRLVRAADCLWADRLRDADCLVLDIYLQKARSTTRISRSTTGARTPRLSFC